MTTADKAIDLYGADADAEVVDADPAGAGIASGEMAIFDPAQYETAEVPSRRQRLMNPLSWLLVVLLTLGVGFYAGVWVQKRAAPAAAGTSARTGGRQGAAAAAVGGTATGGGGGGTGGFGNGGAGNGGGTRGSVILVDKANNAIYIQDAQGNNVKVTLEPQTIMKVGKTTTDVSDYAVGVTVVVLGTTDADGNMTATAITEGAARGGANAAAGAGSATGGAAPATSTTGG